MQMGFDRLRQKALLSKVLTRSKDLQDALDKELEGFSSDESSMISLETLRSLKVGEWHELKNNNGRYRLTNLTKDKAVFITEMNKNGSFGVHEHDCIEEGIVLKGHLIDEENNFIKLENEKWTYYPNKEHRPFCKIKSVYQVTFR